jgi:hypothetical protein
MKGLAVATLSLIKPSCFGFIFILELAVFDLRKEERARGLAIATPE